MKKLLSALCLALLYIMIQGANAPDVGYFQRPDCTTLNPVAYSTVCLNTASGGTLTQGNLYVYATASWTKLLQAETQTLDQVFDNGKTIDGATSFANAVRITDSSGDGVAIYRSAGNGPTVTCIVSAVENDCDHVVSLNSGKNWTIKDPSGNTIINVTAAGVISFGSSYLPKKPIWFGAGSLSVDGTQCAAPSEVTINSGPKLFTIICADNDSSTIYGSVGMPDSWDGGTVTMEGQFIQTAADTSAMNSDIAMQCRGSTEVPSSTWGTEVAMDIANMTGSNAINHVTTAAITPAGTCAAGDTLFFRWQLDAAGTTTAVATLHVVGFKMEYSINVLGD